MTNSHPDTLFTPLDQKSFSGPIQMLKAAIPHLHPAYGKKMAMLARFLEFRHTMLMFEEQPLSICSISENKRPDIEDILKDIRKYCAANEAEQIDQFLNLINAVRLYNQYSELFKNNDISNMINQMNQMNSIKNMNMNISPEQIQLLQNFLHAQDISKSDNSNEI